MQTPRLERPRLERLKERLLAGGVAPRHVRRYLAELQDHFDDALRAERAKGLIGAAAFDAAWARLGNEQELAESILARPELRSLAARFPRTLFGAGPVIVWVALIYVTGFALVEIGGPWFFGHPALSWAQGLVSAICFAYDRILPLLLGAALVVLAIRQRISLRWPMIGAAIIAILAGTSEITATLRTVDHSGELQLFSTLLAFLGMPFTDDVGTTSFAKLASGLARGILNFAIIASPYLIWRHRRRSGAQQHEVATA